MDNLIPPFSPQVHNDKPSLWIEAAKWEFENEGSSENARKILLRGLRFLPKSWVLHREYIKLELLYVEQLRKRSDLLSGGGGGGRRKDKDQSEEVVEEEGDDDEKKVEEDNVTNCSIVRLVVNNAVDSIDDPKFVVSLISTLRIFEFAESITSSLLSVLEERYADHPITWDTLARDQLSVGISACAEKYFQGLQTSPSQELFSLAFSTLTSLAELYPRSQLRVLKQILRLLNFGEEKKLLGAEHYKFWLEILDSQANKRERSGLIKQALTAHPQSVSLWTEELLVSPSLTSSLRRALAAVSSQDSLVVWEVALRLTDPDTAWRLLSEEEGLLDRTNPRLRLLHLDQAAFRSLGLARQVYAGYKDLPPYSSGLHRRMVELEEEEDEADTAQLREILSLLCRQLGHQDPRAWLEAARLEMRAGKPLEAATILARGEASVSEELRANFAVMREQMEL